MNRKKSNTGAFSHLKVPIQLKVVNQLCCRYGINIKGLKIKIQRSIELLNLPITGIADYNNIGRIDLTPNAFIDEEELLKTILHESAHVKQLIKYGKQHVQENLLYMEKIAYRYETFFYNLIKRRSL